MKKVTAYQCSFCKDSTRKLFLTRNGCLKHEKRCWLNPIRKSCATCTNLHDDIAKKVPFGFWKCSKRKDVTPFKTKITECPWWEESGAIFSNEEPEFNRPIERNNKEGS